MATKFITVSVEIMRDENLNQSQKFLLAEIEQLTTLEKGCIASNLHFSNLIGISKENVSKNINALVKKGYIFVEIINGSRNHSRIITLIKVVRPPYQSSKTPLSNRQETKENITTNKTLTKYESFLEQLEKACKYKSKVTKTKDGAKFFKQIEDVSKLFNDYIKYQEEKGNFSVRITDYMKDYKTVHSSGDATELSDIDYWGGN